MGLRRIRRGSRCEGGLLRRLPAWYRRTGFGLLLLLAEESLCEHLELFERAEMALQVTASRAVTSTAFKLVMCLIRSREWHLRDNVGHDRQKDGRPRQDVRRMGDHAMTSVGGETCHDDRRMGACGAGSVERGVSAQEGPSGMLGKDRIWLSIRTSSRRCEW